MKEYICKKDLINNINEGLITSYFGHDAIEVMAEIEYMPAADVVEVVHGKWIGKIPEDEAFAEGVPDNASEDFKKAYRDMMDHRTHCSNCNGALDDRDVIHYRYCPYCGARMDKEN